MSDHIERTIAEFQEKLKSQEEEVLNTKKLINSLLKAMSRPPLYEEASTSERPAGLALKGDEYVGLTQHKACRNILERRKSLNLSPVSVENIYEDLVAGGYQFDTSDVANRRRGLSQMLSKASAVFYRIPTNGLWGLLEWYPGVKQPKKKPMPGIPSNEELEAMTANNDESDNGEVSN